jgi:hypothetical protein
MSVGPPNAHGLTWCTSQRCAGTSQPSTTQCWSRKLTASRSQPGTVRTVRPRASGLIGAVSSRRNTGVTPGGPASVGRPRFPLELPGSRCLFFVPTSSRSDAALTRATVAPSSASTNTGTTSASLSMRRLVVGSSRSPQLVIGKSPGATASAIAATSAAVVNTMNLGRAIARFGIVSLDA